MNRIGWLAAAALLLAVGACSGAPSGTPGQVLNGTNVDRGLVGTHEGGHDGDAEHEDADAEHEHEDTDAEHEREDTDAEHEHGDADAEREHGDAEVGREGAEAEHEDAAGDHGGRGP